ncbi:MAG: hypothetical protein V2A58_07655 [Planctomycetota bacterium]
MCAPEKTMSRRWSRVLRGGLLVIFLLTLVIAQGPRVAAQEKSMEGGAATAPAGEGEAAPVEEAGGEAVEPPVVEKESIKVRPREARAFSVEALLSEPAFVFEMAGRRDPFAGPSKPHGAAEGPETTGKKATKVTMGKARQLSVEEQQQLVDRAQELFNQIKACIAAQDYQQAIRLHDEELMKIMARKEDITAPTLKTKLLAIESGAASVEKLIAEAKLNILYEQITGLHSAVTAAFQAGDYENVIKLAGDLEKVFSVGREALLAAPDSQKRQEVAALKTQADLYRQKAEVRLEFSKKQFVIAGIAWSPQKSFVIVNDKDLTVGATIDDVKIVGIAPGKITMEFKGETFEKYVE